MNERMQIYDELSRVLTEYEEGICGPEDLYDILVQIQANWEDVITCED